MSGRFGAVGDRDQRTQNVRRAFQPLGRRIPLVEEYDLHVRAHARANRMLGNVSNQPIRIVENVVAEPEHSAFGSGLDALHIGAPA